MHYRKILNEFTEPVIRKLIAKFSEVDEQTVRFYLDEFEKYKTELDKKDPFQYDSFEELEQAVDKVKGDKPRVNRDIKIDVDKNDIVAEDDNVVIYRGDTEDKCILYGQGYTFCISRRAAGNMFNHHRSEKESTFYFIYFKNKPKEDNDHIMVLDHTRDGYEWTFSNNDTKKVAGGWDEIVSKYKELIPYRDLLVNKKLDNVEREEIAVIQDFIDDPSIKKFTKMDFNMRSRVLKKSRNLSDDIFQILSKDLINEFLSTGPNLTPLQVASLSDKQKAWYLKNREIQLDEYINEFVDQSYRFNELDLSIPKVQETHNRSYNQAYAQVERKNYDLSDLKFLLKLPSNIPQSITGDFKCFRSMLTSLEGAPEEVHGKFNCFGNYLTSLEGAPSKVDGDFDCRENNLTSLEYTPYEVYGDFNCAHNNLTSLEGVPVVISGNFICAQNNLTSLENGPVKVNGDYICSGNFLTSLEGAPTYVEGMFDCSFNDDLTSLKGSPTIVGGSFRCNGNALISLIGAPYEVGGSFSCSGNALTSLEGIPGMIDGSVFIQSYEDSLDFDFFLNSDSSARELFSDEEIEEAMEDSRRRQAKSMLKENRKFTQKELICNMRYWF